jgi:hypothetical protein
MPRQRMFPPKMKCATVQRICAISDGLQKQARLHVRSKVHGKRYASGAFRLHDDAAMHCAHKYRKTLDHLC